VSFYALGLRYNSTAGQSGKSGFLVLRPIRDVPPCRSTRSSAVQHPWPTLVASMSFRRVRRDPRWGWRYAGRGCEWSSSRARYGVELDEDEAEELWEQTTRPEGPPITLVPIEHIAVIIDSAEKLLPFIVGRPWTLVRFDRRSLVTSDSPVGLIPGKGTGPWDL
jgi:hypothetical protein